MPYDWDETKRLSNFAKRGLDFADAGEVLGSFYRLDIPVIKNGEQRTQSISYELGVMAVLTVAHVGKDGAHALLVSAVQAAKNGRCTMSGSKTNMISRKVVLAAERVIPASKDYVWDGIDDDDRPATEEELCAGIERYKAQRGRPSGSEKTQIALRVDNVVLEAFKSRGKGWQTRMNEALKEWLETLRFDYGGACGWDLWIYYECDHN